MYTQSLDQQRASITQLVRYTQACLHFMQQLKAKHITASIANGCIDFYCSGADLIEVGYMSQHVPVKLGRPNKPADGLFDVVDLIGCGVRSYIACGRSMHVTYAAAGFVQTQFVQGVPHDPLPPGVVMMGTIGVDSDVATTVLADVALALKIPLTVNNQQFQSISLDKTKADHELKWQKIATRFCGGTHYFVNGIYLKCVPDTDSATIVDIQTDRVFPENFFKSIKATP